LAFTPLISSLDEALKHRMAASEILNLRRAFLMKQEQNE